MNKTSQNAMILAHLQQGKSLTSIEALALFNSFRLSGRIYDLRSNGYNIESVPQRLPNGKIIAKYWMKKGNK